MPFIVLEADGIDSDRTIVHGPSADLGIINTSLTTNECQLQPTKILNILEERRGYSVVSHSVCVGKNGSDKFHHTWTLHTKQQMYPDESGPWTSICGPSTAKGK